jgi:hypothetical protein
LPTYEKPKIQQEKCQTELNLNTAETEEYFIENNTATNPIFGNSKKKLLNDFSKVKGKKTETPNKNIKLISLLKNKPEVKKKRKNFHKPELSGIFAIHNDTQDDLFDKHPHDSSSSPISPKGQSSSDQKFEQKTKKTLAKRSRPLSSSEDEGNEEEHGYVIKVKEADNKLSSNEIIGNNDNADLEINNDNSKEYDDDDDGNIISLDDW